MATAHEWTQIGDEIMDSRDLIAVADEIREALEEEDAEARAELIEALKVDEDEAREILAAIDELAEDGFGDWQYGATLIREDHFTEYAKQLADDIGAIDRSAGWPLNHIDWEAAARSLMQDYTEVDYRGTAYLVRS